MSPLCVCVCAVAPLPLITCQSTRLCKSFFFSFVTRHRGFHCTLTLFFFFPHSTMHSEMKNDWILKGGKYHEWNLIAQHKNRFLFTHCASPRTLKACIQTEKHNHERVGREGFVNSGYRSNAGSYYSSQWLHLSPNSWLFSSELLGVLNLQQNRRQISSPRLLQLNAFLSHLFYFLSIFF